MNSRLLSAMDKVHDTPSDVAADDGAVVVDGPDGVAVTFTPEAAEETSARLVDKAAVASGQRFLKDLGQTPD